MKSTHRYKGFEIWPLYEDEGYEHFAWWEIYECLCSGDNCQCPHDVSEPVEIAATLEGAKALVSELAKQSDFIKQFDQMMRTATRKARA